MKYYRSYILMLAALPMIGACAELTGYKAVTAGLYAAGQGAFSNPDVNLTEKNYAAADFLAVQIQRHVDPFDDILVLPLEEVDHSGITSAFGSSVPEGVGLRLVELGYKVWLGEVAAGGNSGLYPSAPANEAIEYVMRGTYAVNKKDVDVYLRVIDQTSKQVVGRFDYTMPLSKELRTLAQTQTQIFKVK